MMQRMALAAARRPRGAVRTTPHERGGRAAAAAREIYPRRARLGARRQAAGTQQEGPSASLAV